MRDADSAALARAAAATRWEEAPREVQHQTLDLWLDSLAVIAAGSVHETMPRLAAQVAPGPGPSSHIGSGRPVAMRDAILLNAATVTVLQRQDGHRLARGHPASQLVPALLALGERSGATGTAVLTALLAGYEVSVRIGIALGGLLPWLHDIGTWTTPGVAVATAHLLSGGEEDAIARAIDGVASLALYLDRFTITAGATVHHLYPALSATNGVAAGEGAAAGLTPIPGTLKRFFGPRIGEAFDPALLTQGIGADGCWSQYEVLNGYFKLHPSCAHLHGLNDAVQALIDEHALTEQQIAAIDIATFKPAMEIDAHAPENDLAARFSAAATTAAAIRYGSLDDAGLEDLDALAPLMRRIAVRHDPDLDQFYPAGRPARITIDLQDGRQLSKEVIHPRGDAANPAPRAELHGKARSLLRRRYDDARTDSIIEASLTLAGMTDLSALSAALCDA